MSLTRRQACKTLPLIRSPKLALPQTVGDGRFPSDDGANELQLSLVQSLSTLTTWHNVSKMQPQPPTGTPCTTRRNTMELRPSLLGMDLLL